MFHYTLFQTKYQRRKECSAKLSYRGLWTKLFNIMDHSEKLAQIVNFLIGTIPYFVAVGAVSSILSIVFMSTAKTQKSAGRIVASSIFLGLYVIVFILVLTGVKAQ